MMRIFVLLILLAETYSQASTSCPASCIVCSEDVVICQKLSTIFGVPNTIRALMLTDGWIDLVDYTMLSNTSNISVLGLSNNAITTINENAFQNLIGLKTLLLDHNNISSQTLNSSTLSWLSKLETLLLGNNALLEINGYWFKNSRKLRILRLEGNLLSTLNSRTFSMSDLSSLETLDLSENFITHVGQDSFRNLPQLRMLDLSRNRLGIVPDAFSYLPWLSELNLDLNRWRCSCDLRELASFLNSYIQTPDKVLHNGQNMMCVSTDNPAVKTVLELTDANCVPPKINITENVETRREITAQQYSRDIALASILFFTGGVLVTLAVWCIVHHKWVMRKGSRPSQKGSETDDLKRSSQGSVKWNVTEDKEALSEMHNTNRLCANCAKHKHRPVWEQEPLALPNRVNTMEPHFTCQSCRTAALIPSMGHGESNHSSETILHLEGSQTATAHKWPFTDERLLRTQSMLRDLLLHGQMQKPPLGRNGQVQNSDILYHGNPRQDASITRDGHPTISCVHCHRAFEHKQQATTTWNKSNSVEKFRAMLQKQTSNYNQSGLPRQAKEHGGKPSLHRNVTFDLTESAMHTIDMHKVKYCGKSPKYYQKLSLSQVSAKSMTANEFERYYSGRACKTHTKRSLKVKLNLNPLKKGKVHPNSLSPRHNKDNPKNIKKVYKQKLRAKVTRNKDDVEQQSHNMSKKGHKSKSPKTSSKKSSQLNLDGGQKTDIEGTVCNPESKNPDNLQRPDPAPHVEDPNEALSESTTTLIQQGVSLDQRDLLLAKGIATGKNGSSTPFISQSDPSSSYQLSIHQPHAGSVTLNEDIHPTGEILSPGISTAPAVVQEYLYSPEGSPKRKIRLIMPEKTTNRPTSALDKKIR